MNSFLNKYSFLDEEKQDKRISILEKNIDKEASENEKEIFET